MDFSPKKARQIPLLLIASWLIAVMTLLIAVRLGGAAKVILLVVVGACLVISLALSIVYYRYVAGVRRR